MDNQVFSSGTGFFKTTSFNADVVFGILGGLVVVLGIVMFSMYRYQRWKRYKVFVGEMQQLGLDPNQEGTFGDLVKRYKMNDPLEILYSLRMFDEIASREMNRVLSSPGSMKAKDEFITTLYEIRQKTYQSDAGWQQRPTSVDPANAANNIA